ncbi:unnamed protein product, partial [Chrysoparadoxa australica]
MFTSDKELKQSRRRPRSQAADTAAGRDEVLEKARREREARSRARETSMQVLLLQRWYRGRKGAALARGQERADWDKKLRDIATLRRTLAQQGLPFALPVPLTLTLIAQFLLFCNLPSDSNRLDLFCSELVLAAGASEQQLNPFVQMLEGHLKLRLTRLLRLCLASAASGSSGTISNTGSDAPLKLMLMLCGCRRHGDLSGIAGASEDGGLLSSAGVAQVCIELLLGMGLFSATRKACLACHVRQNRKP